MPNAIKYWREQHEPPVTQQELSEQIGIDRPLLSKIENPNIQIDPSDDLAEKIARILGVLPTDILRKKRGEHDK